MGAVVIAVVFLAGFVGVPSMFGHGDAHAKPQATQQAATAPAPAQVAEVDTSVYTRAGGRN
jgi:hypothetical protein